MKSNRETRSFAVDKLAVEKRDDSAGTLVGHAAVFNTETEIGAWYREKIKPGAFAESIGRDDVRALFNHDPNYVLGRNKAGTLRMKEDDTGLAVSIDLPDTTFARDLAVTIARGDVTQMSFGFETEVEEIERGDEMPLRTLVKVRLWDVSPVTYPAYPETDVGLRSIEAWKKSQEQTRPAARTRYWFFRAHELRMK